MLVDTNCNKIIDSYFLGNLLLLPHIVVDRTQAMGTIITEPQLQAIVTAAIRAVNGDERNLKTPKQKVFSG